MAGIMKARKHDPEFMQLLRKHVSLDSKTGALKFENLYASLYVSVGWRGNIVSIPYAHVVWFLTHDRWPRDGFLLDHVNDDPFDNRPENHQELTEKDSQAKRRGRMVYRSYGSGKYGHGMSIYHDKRDGRFYVSRYLSRGHGAGDLKTIKTSLGGFNTQEEAEAMIKRYIKENNLA